ncbi:hypothetical protein C8R47DRAFT_1084061 [Mycena vitilis]|nr:hypothetical protein C8R47DRAFT_1084061 [Mycena vitilis]
MYTHSAPGALNGESTRAPLSTDDPIQTARFARTRHRNTTCKIGRALVREVGGTGEEGGMGEEGAMGEESATGEDGAKGGEDAGSPNSSKRPGGCSEDIEERGGKGVIGRVVFYIFSMSLRPAATSYESERHMTGCLRSIRTLPALSDVDGGKARKSDPRHLVHSPAFHGRALYGGPGGFAPAEYFTREVPGVAPPYQQEYNVADYLLEVASDPPPGLFQLQSGKSEDGGSVVPEQHVTKPAGKSKYSTTFLTQLQYLSGREWKILRRDKTLFFTHVVVPARSLLWIMVLLLTLDLGGLYFQTGITIAGFQSRVGCLFFLGALIVFSSLSALYNIVEIRPLFLRERSSSYYRLPQRLIIIFLQPNGVAAFAAAVRCCTSTNHTDDNCCYYLDYVANTRDSTYWMAGLAHDPAHYFKLLFPTHKATVFSTGSHSPPLHQENGAKTSSQILTQINK